MKIFTVVLGPVAVILGYFGLNIISYEMLSTG